MNTVLHMAYRSLLATDDSRVVERPTPDAAPSAFRIWAAGEIATDVGQQLFTDRSAKLLMEEQEKRGNLYSIDLDHLSLEKNRPAEAGRAVGWHRLAVRPDENGAPELWAVEVEWCADIKSGLEMKPPKWRYFSPAYHTDKETKEVVSYTNTALCINPATWGVTQLATRAGTVGRKASMDEKQMLLALKAMMGGEDEKATKAAEMFATMGGEERLTALEAEGGEEEEQHEDTEGGEEEESKQATQAATRQAPAATPSNDSKVADEGTVQLATRVAALENEAKQRAVKDLVASNKDRFTPATRKWALTQPIGVVRSYVKAAPKLDLRAPATTQATRGEEQGSDKANQLPPDQKTQLDERMGLSRPKDAIRREGKAVVFGAMTRDQAQRAIAQKEKTQ